MAAGLALGLVVVWALACQEPPPEKEEATDEVVEIAEIQPRPEPTDEDDEPEDVEPEPVEFATWPGIKKQMTFELMWLGGDEEVALYDEPRPEAEAIGAAGWIDGQEFEWIRTVVYVETPRPYQVEESAEVVVTPYDIEYGELEADEYTVELSAGDDIFLYQYGGEGTCYLGIGTDVVLGDCPHDGISVGDDDLDSEARWTPLKEQWWVEVSSDQKRGWFRVDDAPVSVHAREVEGYEYEDVDGYHDF